MRRVAIALAAFLLPVAAVAQQGETPTDRQAQTGATGAQAEPLIGVQSVPPSVVGGRQPGAGPDAADTGRGGISDAGPRTERPAAPAPNLGAQPASPIARVLASLRDEMRESAELLAAGGQRKLAMETLDAALRLAEFGTRAYGLEARERRPFDVALETVKAARHEVQMGRPAGAASVLKSGADGRAEGGDGDLAGARASMPQNLLPESEGLKLLNVAGKKLGAIDDFRTEGAGLFAAITHGGVLGLGAKTTLVPVGSLLGAENFVVLPDDISPEAFAGLDVFAR